MYCCFTLRRGKVPRLLACNASCHGILSQLAQAGWGISHRDRACAQIKVGGLGSKQYMPAVLSEVVAVTAGGVFSFPPKPMPRRKNPALLPRLSRLSQSWKRRLRWQWPPPLLYVYRAAALSTQRAEQQAPSKSGRLLVDEPSPVLLVLLARHPQLLEGAQGRQDGATWCTVRQRERWSGNSSAALQHALVRMLRATKQPPPLHGGSTTTACSQHRAATNAGAKCTASLQLQHHHCRSAQRRHSLIQVLDALPHCSCSTTTAALLRAATHRSRCWSGAPAGWLPAAPWTWGPAWGSRVQVLRVRS